MRASGWFLVAALLFCSTTGLGVTAILQHEQLDDQELTVERRHAQCHLVRIFLDDTRSSLISDREDLHDWGRMNFEMLAHDHWLYANTCAPIPYMLGDQCASTDLPCQLHALDWALVNIR